MKKIVFLTVSSERKSIWDVVNPQSSGVLILAQILRDIGYDVVVRSSSKIDWHDLISANFVLFSFYSCASVVAYKISDKFADLCNSMGIAVPVRIMGGIHPTYCPEEALRHCEYVIRGEGELSLPELLKELQKESPDLKKISGLSYANNGSDFVHNPQDAMIEDKKILQISPARDLDPNRGSWNRTPVLTPCRGCPYDCEFCSQPFGRKMRMTDPEWVVEEFQRVVNGKYYNPSKVLFIGSDNFTANKKWAKNVLQLALKRGLVGKVKLHIQCRTDFANDSELMELMKPLVTRVYVGVESLDDQTLKRMNKGVSAEEMKRELEMIIKAGIPVHCHFIFGTDFDTPESVTETVKMAQVMGIYAISLFCFTPLPGTRLREKLREQKRIITSDWSYYNLQHVVGAPLLGRPSEFQIAIERGYRDFYSLSNAWRNRELGWVAAIYSGMLWAGFKKRNTAMEEYVKFLQEWENSKYNKDGSFKLPR